jgi:nucleotide-binding universal stress UspA family protein
MRGLELSLVHVWDEAVELSVELDAGSLPDLPSAASSLAVPGPISSALLDRRPDLLVLGGHVGAPHASHLTLACLHHAECPVIVVSDTERPIFGRVVVGVNGTRASLIALRWAAEEARLRGADLVAAYAWQLHPGSAREMLHPAQAVRSHEAAELRRLQGWVESVLGTVVVELLAIHGAPLDVLLDVTTDADLVVLGRSPQAGIARLFHGAVGDDFGGLVPCPVAVIPGAAREFATR